MTVVTAAHVGSGVAIGYSICTAAPQIEGAIGLGSPTVLFAESNDGENGTTTPVRSMTSAEDDDGCRGIPQMFAIGIAPRGIIAVGIVPMGVVSVGVVSMGVVSLGVVAMGMVNVCFVGMGLLVVGLNGMSLW